MDFEIKKYITPEDEFGKFSLDDLTALEEFIKVNIEDRKYGGQVKKFVWGFDLYDFKGLFIKFITDVTKWQPSLKQITSNSHFDWGKFRKLSKVQAVKQIKKECLEAIDRIEELSKKPKDFNVKLFHEEMKQVFDHYLKHNM
jgi:hypothetical protein